MCRVYKAKSGWFVRLCYYHGYRKGEHVPVPKGYVLERQHYPRGGQTSGKGRWKEHSLVFSVTVATNQAAVDDMARYANARAAWDKEDRTVTLSRERGWRNVQPIVDRAVTFGWRRLDVAVREGRAGA